MSDELNPSDTIERAYSSPGLLFPPPSKDDIKKNGLFYFVLSEQERVFLDMVRNSDGLQEFIDLLEAKILYIQFVYPANLGLLFRAIALLERLQKSQRQIFKKDDNSNLEQSLENVFSKLKLPFGLLHDGLPDTSAA
jgi:hypothetical protein